MADNTNTPNPNPNDIVNARQSRIEIESSTKALADLRSKLLGVQDGATAYNNLLREANRNVKESAKAFQKIEARINSYSRGTLNVRDLQNEVFKATQQVELANARMLVTQEQMQLAGLDLQKIAQEKVNITQQNIDLDVRLAEIEEKKQEIE